MNVYTMPGVPDMGMVWMGANQPTQDVSLGFMPQDNGEMLMDQDSNPYFASSHHSISNHSLEDMQNVNNSPMQMDSLDMYNLVDMKQESNDSSYMEEDHQPVYMITTSTQTLPSPGGQGRKIKPIKHPGLVLKTPIAYQSNTDPSVIPIQKDGIAVCQKCGAIGVKHAFYTRQRRFCSMACARGYSGLDPEPLPNHQSGGGGGNLPEKQYAETKFRMEMPENFGEFVTDQPLPQLQTMPLVPPQIEETIPLTRRKNAELANSYDWDPCLSNSLIKGAPVTYFKHAPMADVWHNVMVGMKVEVENTDCDNLSDAFPDSFWVATVLKIIGYKALLRYEGFGHNSTKDFWVSLCSNHVHPVGWCATRGKPLIPPKTIEDKYSDWKDFLRKRLTGARTLPSNYSTKISDSMKSRFHCGLNLEVVDKNRISQVKVAMIHKIVGKRLNVKYYDMPVEDAGFWCHEDSPLLHPVGWAKKVGHNLLAPENYLERINEGIFDEDDATEELFNQIQVGNKGKIDEIPRFSRGMKLEAIDPLNLSSICVATVMEVLNCGYIMIRIDTYESDATGADWFCYHVNSPCIFPAGFCEQNNIPLTPPKGYDSNTFAWNTYLVETSNIPVPANFFHYQTNNVLHGFKPGMKIEAADLMDPRLVCVATVANVVGRLLRVHFDGWEEEYDQWLDCESTDIYPIGWCQSVGHKLEGPRVIPKPVQKTITPPKGMKKRGRKKKVKDAGVQMKPQMNVKPLNILREDKGITSMSLVKEEDDVDFDGDDDELDTGQQHESLVFEQQSSVTTLPPPPPSSSPTLATLQQQQQQSVTITPISSVEEKNPPPNERKVTSYINATSNNVSTKFIPRLIDGNGSPPEQGELCPAEWNVFDVAQFLRVNDCANYCDNFSKQKVDGRCLLELSKENILEYTGGKVGPSLKIYDLIQQLKQKIKPTQSRFLKSNAKKFL